MSLAFTRAKRFLTELRAGQWAWPGGYPLYFVTQDGEPLSFAAAEAEKRQIVSALLTGDFRSQWYVIGLDVNWEDGELVCCHTNERIESAYAETAH